MDQFSHVWMNGKIVKSADAMIHVGTHALHYGTGVFEGMRAYPTDAGPAVFRLTDHIERLHESAKILHIDLPYSVDELRAATWELISATGLDHCYLRPIVFYGVGELRVTAGSNPIEAAILAWPLGAYFGGDASRDGIRAKISSWQRVGPNVIPHAAKATGVYVNSMLAGHEAIASGYDEAILLTADGYVADGSGESVFIVRDQILYTPDLAASILSGITRDAVIKIAHSLGYQIVEKQLIRSDLYLADEVFLVGTAAEVTPVRRVDEYVVGPPGPVTTAVQRTYLDAVHGRVERWKEWLDFGPAANELPNA